MKNGRVPKKFSSEAVCWIEDIFAQKCAEVRRSAQKCTEDGSDRGNIKLRRKVPKLTDP